jgi:hypothetical protein
VGQPARCPECGLVQTVPPPAPTPAPAPGSPSGSPFPSGATADASNPYQPSIATASDVPQGGNFDAYLRYALDKVSLPATLLLVTASLGLLASVCGTFGVVANMSGLNQQQGDPTILAILNGINIVSIVAGFVANIVILLGALRMKNLQSYGLSLTAAILALIPGMSCCCLISMPLGIWSLVVLNDPYVKAAFRP